MRCFVRLLSRFSQVLDSCDNNTASPECSEALSTILQSLTVRPDVSPFLTQQPQTVSSGTPHQKPSPSQSQGWSQRHRGSRLASEEIVDLLISKSPLSQVPMYCYSPDSPPTSRTAWKKPRRPTTFPGAQLPTVLTPPSSPYFCHYKVAIHTLPHLPPSRHHTPGMPSPRTPTP